MFLIFCPLFTRLPNCLPPLLHIPGLCSSDYQIHYLIMRSTAPCAVIENSFPSHMITGRANANAIGRLWARCVISVMCLTPDSCIIQHVMGHFLDVWILSGITHTSYLALNNNRDKKTAYQCLNQNLSPSNRCLIEKNSFDTNFLVITFIWNLVLTTILIWKLS